MTAFTPKSAKPDNVTDRGKVERIKLSGAGDSTEETEWIDVATQAELDAHVNDSSAAHAASAISFAAGGTIAGTDLQTAVAEVATDAAAALASHEADTTSVHGIADTGALVVQAQSVNAQTGTTYTLVAGDAGKLVTLSNASAITLTVPQDSDATIAVGTYVDLLQLGAGQVTVAAGTGATLRTSGLTAKARAQYSRFGVQKIAADTWSLFGDLAAA